MTKIFWCWVVDRRIFCTLTQKKRWKGSCFQLCASYRNIHLSPNVTVRHLSIFFKARKCPSFHTVLGSLRIDPKKSHKSVDAIEWFLVFAREEKKCMKFTTSLELIFCELVGFEKYSRKVTQIKHSFFLRSTVKIISKSLPICSMNLRLIQKHHRQNWL